MNLRLPNLDFLRRMPKGKLQKVVFVCIVTLGAVVGVLQSYVLKNWSALSDTKNQIAKLNDQIQQANHKARQAVQDETQRRQLKAFVEEQKSAMVTGDPFAWVVREISLLAERHPVHVLGMRPGGKEQQGSKSGYDVYTANIDIEAAYDELGSFLQEFENRFPTAEIRFLDISGGDSDHPGRHALLRLVFLVQSEAEPRNAPDKPKQEKAS